VVRELLANRTLTEQGNRLLRCGRETTDLHVAIETVESGQSSPTPWVHSDGSRLSPATGRRPAQLELA
jgi:hypothetical protein